MEVAMVKRRKGAELNLIERKKIEEMREEGAGAEEIAQAIGVSYVTVYRELHRGETDALNKFGMPVYEAAKAQRLAVEARARKGRKNKDEDGRRKKRYAAVI